MFQPTPKRCFTIESLVAKDNPVPASRSEEPIRPAALSYANSGQMNPFLNGFHSGGRGVYSNPDLVFAEAVSHPPNSAVPVHPVAPPHALAAHPLSSSHSPHPLFGSQQRDPSTFYPWLLHRYRYLGHRFQGKLFQRFVWLSFTHETCRAAGECLMICSPLQTENRMHGIKNMCGCSRGIFQFSGQTICIRNYFCSCNDPALSEKKIYSDKKTNRLNKNKCCHGCCCCCSERLFMARKGHWKF